MEDSSHARSFLDFIKDCLAEFDFWRYKGERCNVFFWRKWVAVRAQRSARASFILNIGGHLLAPGEMREGAVGLGHFVGVFFFLDSTALVVECLDKFGG